MDDPYTSPEWGRAALVTIDLQRDFLDGAAFEIAGTSAVLPAVVRLVVAFRARRLPIIHVVRLYTEDGANADVARRRLIEQGALLVRPESEGSELAGALLPSGELRLDAAALLSGDLQQIGPAEFVMFKPRWGAFYKTPLESALRARGVTTVLFAGCNFPNCPRTSIFQASERDFRVVVAQDAVSGFYERGGAELRNIGVRVMDTDAIVEALDVGQADGGGEADWFDATAPLVSAVRHVTSLSPRFNWTGIYLLRGDTLELGPFIGAPTEHTHIPVGRGVCGTAVAEGRDINVPDVSQSTNYLSCSDATRSELVVLIRNQAGTIVGQIDIDSHTANAFGPEEEAAVRRVADTLGAQWPESPIASQ